MKKLIGPLKEKAVNVLETVLDNVMAKINLLRLAQKEVQIKISARKRQDHQERSVWVDKDHR